MNLRKYTLLIFLYSGSCNLVLAISLFCFHVLSFSFLFNPGKEKRENGGITRKYKPNVTKPF
jgi:hypothetical protein